MPHFVVKISEAQAQAPTAHSVRLIKLLPLALQSSSSEENAGYYGAAWAGGGTRP